MLRKVLFLCVVACFSAEAAACPPVTTSPSGVFRGSWLTSRRGSVYQAYRGIRYAQPPVGELRFQPPALIESYEEEVDATQDGPAYPQPVDDNFPVDEDCLRINVYTPDNNSSAKLPVLMYIHEGAFYSMSGRSDSVGPEHMLDRNVVLVAINYRLATLGFISTGDKYAPGNNGFKDQVAALKWVKKNIAAFGGNPKKVTISGYHAGSFSVMLHTLSPMSKGLFHRAICMSGSPISHIEVPKHQMILAQRQAYLLNCSTESSQAIIECLKTKTWKEIADTLDDMFEFGYDPLLLWLPIEEEDFGQERFMPQQPLAILRQEGMQKVPMIMGQTELDLFWKGEDVVNNEQIFTEMKTDWTLISQIAFFLSNDSEAPAQALKQAYLGDEDLARDARTVDGLGKLYSDSITGFGVHRLSNLLRRVSKKPVYMYEFTYFGNSSHYVDRNTNKTIGAVHHDELIYLFNITGSFPAIPPDGRLDSDMVDKMTALLYNFARYGDPNPRKDTPELSGLSWPPMKKNDSTYLRIGQQFSLQKNLFGDRFKVWEKLFPLDYDTFK